VDAPDVNQLTPASGKQGAPSSGTYGEGADLARLQQELPTAPAGAPPMEQPGGGVMPTVAPPQMGSAPQAPGTLPAGLTAPSRHPDMPVSQALTPNMGPQFVGTPREQRIQILHALTMSNDVSAETKEVASTMLKWLIRTPQ
jgi:hypothetical protein